MGVREQTSLHKRKQVNLSYRQVIDKKNMVFESILRYVL